MFSSSIIKQNITCLHLNLVPGDLSLAFWGDRCTTEYAPPLTLALGPYENHLIIL